MSFVVFIIQVFAYDHKQFGNFIFKMLSAGVTWIYCMLKSCYSHKFLHCTAIIKGSKIKTKNHAYGRHWLLEQVCMEASIHNPTPGKKSKKTDVRCPVSHVTWNLSHVTKYKQLQLWLKPSLTMVGGSKAVGQPKLQNFGTNFVLLLFLWICWNQLVFQGPL